MQFNDYTQHDGLGLADLVRRGEVSPGELLEAALMRTDHVNTRLNAVVRRYDERARTRIKQGFRPDQPFAGLPFLLKDLFQEWEGAPCSWGNLAHARQPAPLTCDVVRRWENAGVVIFGATNTPEFGAKNVTEPKAFGPARNPWNTQRTTGGSSGGAGAAVAAGIVPVAGASDGGGSIRIPAASNGLFGLKAGRGRVSIGPMAAEGLFGAAVHGVISRSVRDSAAMLDVMQGPEPHAPYWMPPPEQPYLTQIQRPPKALRIGFTTESPTGTPVDAQAVAATEEAARLLAALGHHIEPVALPFDGPQLSSDFLHMWYAAQAMLIDELCRTDGLKHSDFELDTQVMASLGHSISAPELMGCLERWHQHTLALTRFHSQYDLWLSPTISAPPIPVGALDTPPALHVVNKALTALGLLGQVRKTRIFQDIVMKNLGWTPYTQLANVTGRPAMSVPLYWTPDGLPLGVQFVGPVNSEGLLLQLAAQLEQARPWFDKRPPL